MSSINLLTESAFTAQDSKSIRRLSLSGVLAVLSGGVSIEFSALQPHQRHAWHAFLTQLAALALFHSEQSVGEFSYGAWNEMLLRLTDGDVDPFCLVTENLAKAAFLQCPVPEGSVGTWESFFYPDPLDVLVTAKNHDVKMARIIDPRPEHWIYALVSVQTMQGFWGRNHYGITRMNSGIGSRTCVSVARGPTFVERFNRDVSVWLEQRKNISKIVSGKLALCWLDPWDGTRSPLTLQDLDPFFIETCSRIRLAKHSSGRVMAYATHVPKPHIQIFKGMTGEIWTIVRKEDEAALSPKQDPFSYEGVSELLFGEAWTLPASAVPREEDGEHPVIILQGLSRGQGKTEGFYERFLYPSKEALSALKTPEALTSFYEVVKQFLEIAYTVRLRILKPALLSLIQGGTERLKMDDARVMAAVDEFRQFVDGVFFDQLFREPSEDRLVKWTQLLAERARQILMQAREGLPIPLARKERAVSVSSRLFWGSMAVHFPGLEKIQETSEHDSVWMRRRKIVRTVAQALVQRTSGEDIALLRQLAPTDEECPPFRYLYDRFFSPRVPEYPATPRQWAVVVRSMATLVGLHRPGSRLGRAMAKTGLSEPRVRALLCKQQNSLEEEVCRVSRWMTTHAVGFDQMELVDLVLSDRPDAKRIQNSWYGQIRTRIAMDYYASL